LPEGSSDLDILAEDMVADVAQDMADADFEAAVNEWRRRESWMPTAADLLKVHADLERARALDRGKLVALPSRTGKTTPYMTAVFALMRERGWEGFEGMGKAFEQMGKPEDWYARQRQAWAQA
jgi:hypothetical protein